MIHVNKERLGDFIGSERKNLGLTQRDLAARLHVTDKAVSKWESGASDPSTSNLLALAKLYGVSAEELLREAAGTQRT